jgi:hypothetical protein
MAVEAGAVPKPTNTTYTVQGFYNVTYKITFAAKAQAVISVQGDGDTQLSLVILDSTGKRVAVDTRANDVLIVRFTPAKAGVYQVRIINHGGVPNRFALRTN